LLLFDSGKSGGRATELPQLLRLIIARIDKKDVGVATLSGFLHQTVIIKDDDLHFFVLFLDLEEVWGQTLRQPRVFPCWLDVRNLETLSDVVFVPKDARVRVGGGCKLILNQLPYWGDLSWALLLKDGHFRCFELLHVNRVPDLRK